MNESLTSARQFVIGLRSVIDSDAHTDKEREIAAFLVEQGHAVATMGIADIAHGVNVSNAMVVKFCKRQGLAGFSELRRVFELAYENRAEQVYQELDVNDSPARILQKMCSNSIQDLEDSLAIFDFVAFEKAVEAVRWARRTSFYAVGGSGPLALDAHHKFMLIGLNSHAYTDGHLQAMDAALLTMKDVAVGISYGGNTKEVNRALALAQEQGAKTISITNNPHSNITKVSDICLYTAAQGTPLMGENSSARFVQMIVISALGVSVAASDQGTLIDTMRKTIDAVKFYRTV